MWSWPSAPPRTCRAPPPHRPHRHRGRPARPGYRDRRPADQATADTTNHPRPHERRPALPKAAGYRDSRPIPVSAVYVAPPPNHRKDRFKSVSTQVIRQPGDSFAPGLLADFVAAARQAKEAGS